MTDDRNDMLKGHMPQDRGWKPQGGHQPSTGQGGSGGGSSSPPSGTGVGSPKKDK